MMNNADLQKKITENLKQQGTKISVSEIENLYNSTLSEISAIINDGNTLEISNFGSFWKKEGAISSVTFFKPADKLIEQINKD